MSHFFDVPGEATPAAVTPYEHYLPKPPEAIARLIVGMGGRLRHTLLNDYLFRALLQEL